MKNRKTIVAIFMLVAVMILSVGYAVLTDTLNIEGDIEVSHTNAENAFDQLVYFSNVSNGEGYTAEILTTNNDKGNFTVTDLSEQGQTIEITFTIANDNDFAIRCKLDPTNTAVTNETYFGCSTNVGDQPFVIGANDTYDVVVTVELVQIPQLAEGQQVSGTFNIEYDVTDIVTGG